MPIFEKDFTFNYFGHTIHARPLGTETIPATSLITSVHVVPITSDDKIVAVNIKERGYDIPGGHIDIGEDSPITALRRELREEANVTIFDPVLLEVLSIQCDTLDLSQRPHMLLYAGRVDQVNDFIEDDEVSERALMEPEEFVNSYFGNKAFCTQLVKAGLDAISTRKPRGF